MALVDEFITDKRYDTLTDEQKRAGVEKAMAVDLGNDPEKIEQARPQIEQLAQLPPAHDSPRATPAPLTRLLTPRITLRDLKGPTGQSALASGLALGAVSPPGLEPAGFVAGVLSNLAAEEGTRRLQEQIGEIPGLAAGIGLGMAAGAPLYKIMPGTAQLDLVQEGLEAVPANRIAQALKSKKKSSPILQEPVGSFSETGPSLLTIEDPAHGQIFVKNLEPKLHQSIMKAAETIFTEHPEWYHPDLTKADNVVHNYLTGNIPPDVVAAYGIDPTVLITQFRESIRQSAQRMAYHSQVMRNLKLTPEEAEVLRKTGRAVDEDTVMQPVWKRLDNVRRALMVSQLSTAVRNFTTQLGRVGLDVLQAPLDTVIQKLAGVPASSKATDGLTEMLTIFQRGTKETVTKILDRFPTERDRLLMTYSSDVPLPTKGTLQQGTQTMLSGAEQAANVVNWANRLQEFVVRRGVFQSALDQDLRTRGLDLQKIIAEKSFKEIPKESIEKAVSKALEVTWGETPKYGTAAKAFIDFINKTPGATLAIPFPRFITNAINFNLEYNPTGILRYLTKAERTKFAAGDTSGVSKAVIGSTLLLAAYEFRTSSYAGEQWYEARGPHGEGIDLRPFNPFTPYLFVADVLHRIKTNTLNTMTSRQWAEGLAGFSVRAGTGLAVIDDFAHYLQSGGDAGEKMKKFAAGTAGEIMGNFATPLQQLVDLVGEFDRDHRIARDARDEPLMGRLKSRVPGVVTGLPEQEFPTRAGPSERIHPFLLKQALGLSVRSADNPLEREINRFGLNRPEVLPMTGNATVDRAKAKWMGYAAEQVAPFFATEGYRQLSDPAKYAVLSQVLQKLRAATARPALSELLPEVLLKERLKHESKPIRKLLEAVP